MSLVIAVAWLLFTVLGVARMLWRVGRHNEQLEAGGSLSHQMFGRAKKKKPGRPG